MKVSQMILNSIAAVADYEISFEDKMAEIERLQNNYQAALKLENEQALSWYNETFPEGKVEQDTIKPVKKETKLQTIINAVQQQLNKGNSLSEAIQFARSTLLKSTYIKTERAYVSKLKKHFSTH